MVEEDDSEVEEVDEGEVLCLENDSDCLENDSDDTRCVHLLEVSSRSWLQ